jgi:hypothetical protein
MRISCAAPCSALRANARLGGVVGRQREKDAGASGGVAAAAPEGLVMKLVAGAVLGAVVGAILVLIVDAARSSRPAVLPATGVPAIGREEIAALKEQVEQLTREIETLRATPEPARVEVAPIPEIDLASLASRVDGIEKRLDRFDGAGDRPAALPKLTEPKSIDVTETQRVASNRGASEEERLDALKKLRGRKTETGADARTHDVVLAMLEIAEFSTNEESRNAVYRDLHGADDAAVRDSMLRALANDSSVKVRKRAAMDIDTYLGHPLVDEALRRAADHDADAGVRAQAAETLAKKPK